MRRLMLRTSILERVNGQLADLLTGGIGGERTRLSAGLAGQLDEADAWVQRAERTIDAEDRPVVAMGIKYLRGQLELGRGRPAAALAAFEAAQ
jgi:hypothetical protein